MRHRDRWLSSTGACEDRSLRRVVPPGLGQDMPTLLPQVPLVPIGEQLWERYELSNSGTLAAASS